MGMMQEYRAKRAAAIHDPVVRSRAIEPNECARQVQEKYSRIAAEKESDKLAAAEEKRISRLIAQKELESKARQKAVQNGVRTSWDAQSDRSQRTTAYLDPKITKPEPIDADNCGLVAAQKFQGEDRQRFERKRLQARQIASWTQNQIAEKQTKKLLEKSIDVQYINGLDEVDKLCQATEIEADAERKKTRIMIAKDNQFSTMVKNNALEYVKKKERDTDLMEMAYQTTGILAEKGGPGKMDFKGFDSAMRAQFEAENQALVVSRQGDAAQAMNEDRAYVRNLTNLNKKILRSEVDQQQQRALQSKQLQEVHKYQMQQKKISDQKSAAQAKGEVTQEFFGNFGTSFR